MEQQFYPYYDGDIQAQVKAELGEDKLLVFNPETNDVHLAQKIGERYVVDTSKDQPQIANMIRKMEEGTWQRKSS